MPGLMPGIRVLDVLSIRTCRPNLAGSAQRKDL